jgi:hypothetical protein
MGSLMMRWTGVRSARATKKETGNLLDNRCEVMQTV